MTKYKHRERALALSVGKWPRANGRLTWRIDNGKLVLEYFGDFDLPQENIDTVIAAVKILLGPEKVQVLV